MIIKWSFIIRNTYFIMLAFMLLTKLWKLFYTNLSTRNSLIMNKFICKFLEVCKHHYITYNWNSKTLPIYMLSKIASGVLHDRAPTGLGCQWLLSISNDDACTGYFIRLYSHYLCHTLHTIKLLNSYPFIIIEIICGI